MASSAAGSTAGSPARLMVVDDTLFMRRMLRDLLVRGGYEVAGEARNGREAAENYQQIRPDLVIMDITMPEMDGIQAVRAIQQIDPQARIVMCSALGQDEPVMEALQAGAQDFVLKPFVPEKVLEVVQKTLSFRQEFGPGPDFGAMAGQPPAERGEP